MIASVVFLIFVQHLVIGKGYSPRSFAVQLSHEEHSADEIAASHGLINRGKVEGLDNIFWFEEPSSFRSKVRAPVSGSNFRQLSTDQHVLMVEEQTDLWREKRQYNTPTDPRWHLQWTLLNNGQFGEESTGRDINVEPAWIQGLTGLGVTVVIVDDGILFTNRDLTGNFDPSLSEDLVDGDKDVTPATDPETGKVERHGTACAGVVAMAKDNGECGVGVAFESRIAGIRLLSSRAHTDIMEAAALGHALQEVDIFSNSWGPYDNGVLVEGPGLLAKMAFHNGVQTGRGGLGSIYVWAAGNGRGQHDSCSTDGYVGSIYTIAVGSVDQHGKRAFYDEECPAKMAVTFNHNTRGESSFRSHITTTGADVTSCRSSFLGTSAACALTSGSIALALQANPTLTWRDVQHLIVTTSSHRHVGEANDWIVNGGGHHISRHFGFGALDVGSLVSHARVWNSVPQQLNYTVVPDLFFNRIAWPSSPLIVPVNVTFDCPIHHLEHVVMKISLDVAGFSQRYSYSDFVRESNSQWGNVDTLFYHNDARRGDISISLTSPHNTMSVLLPKRQKDFVNARGFDEWPFMSVLHWGESPHGMWTLNLTYSPERHVRGFVIVRNVSLMMYGTSNLSKQRGIWSCDLRNATDLQCIDSCPPEFKVHRGYCIDPVHRYVYNDPSVTSELPLTSELMTTIALNVTVTNSIGHLFNCGSLTTPHLLVALLSSIINMWLTCI